MKLRRPCLKLATGGNTQISHLVIEDIDPFDHPDAQRRFRVMNNVEELERALEYPWEKWTIFLHPDQRQLVERDYNGPARVSGSAGTGKPSSLFTEPSFWPAPIQMQEFCSPPFPKPWQMRCRIKLRRLISNEPRIGERLEVHGMNQIGQTAL